MNIVKSVTMISWEFDPFYIRGGTAYAIRRLADQLTGLGIETRVLLPDRLNRSVSQNLMPLLRPMPLKMKADFLCSPRVLQCDEFCRAAVEAVDHIRTSSGSGGVIAHSDEGAMFIVLRNGNRSIGPSVFWLHSLYDPPIGNFSPQQRRSLPSESLLASAVMMADIVVTSKGILKDARDFEWPGRLEELRKALTDAAAEDRLLTVESMGCLPAGQKNSERPHCSNVESLRNMNSPYVLFPCRPTVDKGVGIFEAIADRLRAINVASVAVRAPAESGPKSRSRNGGVHWLPWLDQYELQVVMRNAACTVLPSITEGFGLAAAESINLRVPTLYHEVGGQYGLRAFPNALAVPLTTSERAHLYRLWEELVSTCPDSRSVWNRHETLLRPLVDKWIEAITSVIQHVDRKKARTVDPDFAEWPMPAEPWGSKLRRRLETRTVR